MINGDILLHQFYYLSSDNFSFFSQKQNRDNRDTHVLYVVSSQYGGKKNICHDSYFDWLKHMQIHSLIYRLIMYFYAELACVWEGLCAFNLHVDFPSYLIPCLSLA